MGQCSYAFLENFWWRICETFLVSSKLVTSHLPGHVSSGCLKKPPCLMFPGPIPRKSLQNDCTENNSKTSTVITDHGGQAYFCPYFNVELKLWSQFISATNIKSRFFSFCSLSCWGFVAGISTFLFTYWKKKKKKRKASLTCL